MYFLYQAGVKTFQFLIFLTIFRMRKAAVYIKDQYTNGYTKMSELLIILVWKLSGGRRIVVFE